MDALPETPTPQEFCRFVTARAVEVYASGRTPAIVTDRDGTPASVAWCAPSEDGRSGWHRFNMGLPFDALVPYVRDLVHAAPSPTVHRFMFSGRAQGDRPGENFRYWQMVAWLRKVDLRVDDLLMREAGDQRRDSIIKNEFVDAVEAKGFTIVAAIDDRQQVCDEVWRARGIPLVQVVDPAIEPLLLSAK